MGSMASVLDDRVLAHKPLKAQPTPMSASIPPISIATVSASTPTSEEIQYHDHYDMLIANSSHMSLSALESCKHTKMRVDSNTGCTVEIESVEVDAEAEVEKCLSDIDIDDSIQSKQKRALRKAVVSASSSALSIKVAMATAATEQELLTTTLPNERVENRPSSVSDFFNPQACVMHKKFGGMRRNWTFLSLNGMVDGDCAENENEDVDGTGAGSGDKKVIMQERKRARIGAVEDDQP